MKSSFVRGSLIAAGLLAVASLSYSALTPKVPQKAQTQLACCDFPPPCPDPTNPACPPTPPPDSSGN